MRMTRLLAACAVVVLQAAAGASQQRPVQSDREVLIELEQRWNMAFYRRDAAFIATILADDFVATYDDGSRGDKAKELALASNFAQQVESAVQDEFTVKEYGDTALVRFTLHLAGTRQGVRVETLLRYTDVWIIRDGRWQCVSSHSTQVTN
jgi:ketosteroid isomerase-like protein